MLTLYFSGTGNTEYVAKLFSQKMSAKCFSIEDDALRNYLRFGAQNRADADIIASAPSSHNPRDEC